MVKIRFDRRQFLAASAGAIGLPGLALADAPDSTRRFQICAFIKFVQSLSYDELADTMVDLGFDGIEATVRKGGYIPPERAADELPRLVEALDKRNLNITVMTTDVLRPDDPHAEQTLRTAASLGIERYRLGFYRYDLSQPIVPQLASIRPAFVDLAAMNQELGIQGVYQNHSGANFVGAVLWDVRQLLDGIPPEQLGVAFDIRHATVEAGLAWPVQYDIMKPHIGVLYAKDFSWDGRKAKHVPLGSGRVDPKFFALVKRSGYAGPISLHVEYLPKAGTQPNIEALRHDLAVLRKWLA